MRDGKNRINLQKKRDTTVRRNTAAAVSFFSLQKGQIWSRQQESRAFRLPNRCISSAALRSSDRREGEGPLGDGFDLIAPEADFGEETWEQAESTMQQEALQLAIGKAGLKSRDIRYLFGGDLLAQLTATSFGSEETQIPLFGLYSACSTCGEALALAALTVSAGCAEHVAAVTSSHFGSAEKEFRLPLGYGQPASIVRDLDGDRKRGICSWKKRWPCADQRCDTREDCGYGKPRQYEYGGLHGSGRL